MGEGRWSKPRYLQEINNTVDKKLFVGGCFQSYDGKYLLFTSDSEEGYGNMDILISERKIDKWGKPENIGLPINTPYFDGFPSLSIDGNELYFMRNIKPGVEPKKGRFYLYVSTKNENGEWGEPRLLPEEINGYKVECPRILPNGQSLMFASVRPEGQGGYDIYKVEKEGDGIWSAPKNIELLNSPFDENTFTVEASGEIMYFARTENGIDNLYMGFIPKMEELVPTIQLKGNVVDAKTGKLIAAEIKLIDAETNNTIKLLSTTEKKPEYSIYLQRGKNLLIEANSPGYSFGSESVNLKSPELNLEETTGERMGLKQIFNQLILEKEDDQTAKEAFTNTDEANALLTRDMLANETKIKEMEDLSLKAPDTKTMKKQLEEVDRLKAKNQNLNNEAIAKYRMANQSFLELLNKYIDNYKVTSDEKIAALGQKLEEEGAALWTQAKTERTNADNGNSNAAILKAHKLAKELEGEAIKKYALAFEYYLQFLNFNKNLIEKDIALVPLKKDVSIVLKNIQFDFDSDSLKESSITELEKVLYLLNENPKLKIEISAHSDSQGPDDYNLKLSDRRANSVVNWLTRNQIESSRLEAKGYGESKPKVPNDSEDNMAINRRVEFTILEN
jgi:outer membrane protein OmpA-like peptidoglycan-associated protein